MFEFKELGRMQWVLTLINFQSWLHVESCRKARHVIFDGYTANLNKKCIQKKDKKGKSSRILDNFKKILFELQGVSY